MHDKYCGFIRKKKKIAKKDIKNANNHNEIHVTNYKWVLSLSDIHYKTLKDRVKRQKMHTKKLFIKTK